MRRVSLKLLIAAAISVVSLLLTVAVSYVIGRDAVNRLEQQIGRSLALLADETQDKLDRAMFERLQSLENLAAVGEIQQKTETPASLRAALERFQTAYSDYSWVGFADANGNVVSATGGELEGKNVKDQTWFRHGSKGPFVGEVNLPGVKSGPIMARGHGVPKFIDLAVPVASGERNDLRHPGCNLERGLGRGGQRHLARQHEGRHPRRRHRSERSRRSLARPG